ncbi:MAG: DMT family transporter [Eubacteriales bacterium]|nr:DMT family transporter [Eubacteriales bacterium]
MINRKMLGNLLLTLTALIWGTAFVFQRKGMESIEPITFTSARMALAAVAVGGVAVIFGKREKTGKREKKGKREDIGKREEKDRRRNTVLGGVCCGAFLAAASIFQQMGIVYTTAGKAGFITAMYMILVPVIGFVLFHKNNTWLVWLAVVIGVAGMYLLCMTEGFTLTRGDTLVCICAVLFSGHILCIDYFVQRGDPIRISAIQFVACSAISAVAALILEEPTPGKIVSAAIPILYCGILSGGVGYTLQIVAQKYTDPTIASLLMSLESVFAVIAGALLLHERMTARELAGCVVMFIAILLVQIPLPEKRVRKMRSS